MSCRPSPRRPEAEGDQAAEVRHHSVYVDAATEAQAGEEAQAPDHPELTTPPTPVEIVRNVVEQLTTDEVVGAVIAGVKSIAQVSDSAVRKRPISLGRQGCFGRILDGMQTHKTPRRRAAMPVKNGHHPKRGLTGNRAKLSALIRIFDLRVGVVAKCSGRFSRTYVQRVISPNDSLEGSAEFYRLIESALPELVRRRRRAFFSVPSTDGRRVDALVRSAQTDFSSGL